MNVLELLRGRFRGALLALVSDDALVGELVAMVRPSTDAKFGDYQANFAMPLGKRLGKSPRDVAADVVSRVDVSDVCRPAEVAGPGFINLTLRDDWLARAVGEALRDEVRIGVSRVERARTFVIDYSAPNVAKPMHVGHIRSTVIGDALYKILKFLGHRVISDNHIGDWGTQFGMILYGWKHFRDEAAYKADPVSELARLYRLVRQLMDYQDALKELPAVRAKIAEFQSVAERVAAKVPSADKAAAKKLADDAREVADFAERLANLEAQVAAVENNPTLAALAQAHAGINQAVLQETVFLHTGDPENLRLWREFLPPCLADIEQIYRRLDVTFDNTLGESFYHDRLGGVVADLERRGLVRESEGAKCVFLEGFDHPMIVQKRDGAFLYATSDLATIQYRMETWRPDAILYVVDHRQSGHFGPLFAAARLWGYQDVELTHVSFGTVLGDDNRPFKTRSGDTVGLGGLLDEAERRAYEIVKENDDAKPQPELSQERRREIATTVGIAAIKYADLAHNRTSDYVFSYDKMLATKGNTATYMQYAYARVRSIFRKGALDGEALRAASERPLVLAHPAERALALGLLGFEVALHATVADYRPNQLTAYLFELATRYSTFYQECEVLRAEPAEVRISRLLLCELTARTLRKGLELLGIKVVEQM
jgi:arginyl-tRNA synthetase